MTLENKPVPGPGAEAPDFTLASTSGAQVTLSDFRGKSAALIAFFPLAFTSTCTQELCDLSDDYSAFSDAQVTVLPISVDSVPTLKEFKAKHGMKTELLSDFKREAGPAYGVMWQDAFFTNRAYFLVDSTGIVRWAHVEETPSGKRTNAEILAEIAKL
ncbi:MAG: redoxin domain-containing protein [Gemmatimonadota bacterium]|nr:redoxin domain-containing protein [Gemmatimonadota bacterium]